VGQAGEKAPAEDLKVFEIGLADFPEEEAIETGEALAIVGAELGEEPVGFAAAAGAAETDGAGTAGGIAEASGGAGGELPFLEDETGIGEVEKLIPRTARVDAELEELFQLHFRVRREGRFRRIRIVSIHILQFLI